MNAEILSFVIMGIILFFTTVFAMDMIFDYIIRRLKKLMEK